MQGGEILVYTRILVANTGDDSLSVIDLKENVLIQTISLSKLAKKDKQLGSHDITISEEGLLYIVNPYDDSIMKIDFDDTILLDIIKVGRHPTSIKVFGDKIYVVNSDSNSISIIDGKTFSLIEDVSVGEKPTDIQIDDQSLKIFVSNENSYSISILDVNSETISSLTLDKQPIKILIDDKRLFVLSYINNGITNYSNLSEMEMGNYSSIMSIDLKGIFNNFIKLKDKEIFYMSNAEDGYLYKISIDDEVSISKIYLGGMPGNIISDGENKLYITNTLSNDLTIIDESSNRIINKIRVGKEPYGILLL